VLNKSDLGPLFANAWNRLLPYRDMGYDVLPLCLKASSAAGQSTTLSALQAHLTARVTLILGPSGVGKSTLINHFVPTALALTNEISRALNSGKHTTTSTHWYWADDDKHTALIDSPGFQEFGLHHISPDQLAALMPDMRRHLGNCKFYNCTHLHEPGCGVTTQLTSPFVTGQMVETRYQIYSELFAELSAIRHW
jgi:ribosome biogenesis GTPase / thiamine phosphate phosphatase